MEHKDLLTHDWALPLNGHCPKLRLDLNSWTQIKRLGILVLGGSSATSQHGGDPRPIGSAATPLIEKKKKNCVGLSLCDIKLCLISISESLFYRQESVGRNDPLLGAVAVSSCLPIKETSFCLWTHSASTFHLQLQFHVTAKNGCKHIRDAGRPSCSRRMCEFPITIEKSWWH